MSLKDYTARRDFSRSPEPPPKEKSSTSGRLFCVQKHLATQLHYDFRLEHNGVLLSWAVPKGPSLDPTVKRLAMQVEDHPLDYGSFEGVIPEGYGAGIVMLWDSGTWEPQDADVDQALRKGDLKFRLNGYKLKGSWVLVRTGGYGRQTSQQPRGTSGQDGKSWLLIKHRDEWSGPLDIAEFAPDSVKSGGDFADILAAEPPEFWCSGRPGRSGRTGALLKRIVERALALRAEREARRGATGARAERETLRAPARPTSTRSKQSATRSRGSS